MLEPDIASIPFAPSRERSLESLLGEAGEQFMTVHLPYLSVDAVVLGAGDRPRDVRLLFDGGDVKCLFGSVIAQRITDSTRQAALLRQALVHQHAAVLSTQARLNAASRRVAETLADVRDFAIAEYRAGHLDRAQLDALLRTFQLQPFTPRQRVAFTITGTYLVEGADSDHVRDNGLDRVAASFDRVDGVIAESDIYTVTVDSVTTAE